MKYYKLDFWKQKMEDDKAENEEYKRKWANGATPTIENAEEPEEAEEVAEPEEVEGGDDE